MTPERDFYREGYNAYFAEREFYPGDATEDQKDEWWCGYYDALDRDNEDEEADN